MRSNPDEIQCRQEQSDKKEETDCVNSWAAQQTAIRRGVVDCDE